MFRAKKKGNWQAVFGRESKARGAAIGLPSGALQPPFARTRILILIHGGRSRRFDVFRPVHVWKSYGVSLLRKPERTEKLAGVTFN